jgi:integrase/recombinase XerC
MKDMGGLLNRFIRYLEVERNASPFTVRNYRSDISHFLEFLEKEGLSSLGDVHRPTMRQYLTRLLEQGFVKASISRKLSAIRALYRYLLLEGVISENPLTSTSSPKLEKRLPSFLTIEEMKRILETPDTTTPQGMRDRALLELFYASGLRVSEIVRLDLHQVDLRDRQVRVWGKGSKERMVLLGKPAAKALSLYLHQGRPKLSENGKNTALFLNRYGRRLAERRVQIIVQRYAEEAGLEKRVHPHLLRHTFATHLLDGGADLRVVQELLGHASLASTQIYTHVTQRQARKVYLAAHPRARGRKKSEGES